MALIFVMDAGVAGMSGTDFFLGVRINLADK